jgi:hypothetical protein
MLIIHIHDEKGKNIRDIDVHYLIENPYLAEVWNILVGIENETT